MSKLGIIATKGNLSKQLIDYAQSKLDIFMVAIEGITDPEFVKGVDHIWVRLGEIGKAIDAMKQANVDRIVFSGPMKKPDIFSLKLDLMGTKLLAKMAKDKFFGDNKLLSVLTNFLEEHGFKVIGVHEILKDLVVKASNFTKLVPNEDDKIDIDLGIKVVKELGKLDIGQGAIIHGGAVLGVEAMEGTEELINRCGKLKHSDTYGGVLVKLSKPEQELRADLPTIGIDTIKSIHMAGFKGIAIEAERAIFLDREECIKYADKHELFIVAL